jgi:hypothetical protein
METKGIKKKPVNSNTQNTLTMATARNTMRWRTAIKVFMLGRKNFNLICLRHVNIYINYHGMINIIIYIHNTFSTRSFGELFGGVMELLKCLFLVLLLNNVATESSHSHEHDDAFS